MASQQIIVDGTNVAYAELSEAGNPQVSNLVAMCQTLEHKGYHPTLIVEASLRHTVDDPEQLEALLDDRRYRQAPAGTDADYFVLETADRLQAQVVSNDEFEEHRDRYPWIPERRVPFMIVQGQVELYQDKLSERGADVGE